MSNLNPAIAPNTIKITPANECVSLKCNFKNLAREVKMIRGEIIDTMCNVESAIGYVLASLQKHGQYHKILKTVQPQLGGMLLALQAAMKIEFSHQSKLKKFEPLIPALLEALEIRNLMAHAEIKIATFESLDFFLLLSYNEFEKGVPRLFERTTSITELKKKSQKLVSLYGKIENLRQDW